MDRIFLSPPHLTGSELDRVARVLESNWVAPVGPEIEAFEREFAEVIGVPHAVALSSGTSALHLALLLSGVGPGDRVVCPSLTFAATAFAVTYLGAVPVFVDCSPESWNLDPGRLQEALSCLRQEGERVSAVIAVDLYGQSADWQSIREICDRYEVGLVEDAAEALGATYRGRAVGTFGDLGVFSFNGNKIITTSGGGMLVSQDGAAIDRARRLASQAREEAAHYEHAEIGFNYRMSNVLAAIGRSQLRLLAERVEARRQVFEWYRQQLADLPGLDFMPEASWGRSSRWLTCILLDAKVFGANPAHLRLALEAENIESRPVWKPMHLQPVFRGSRTFGGEVATDLFERGLCLPSGSALSARDVERIAGIVRHCSRPGRRSV